MTTHYNRALFWTPRLLSIVCIAFLSSFSLDVFGEGLSLWRTIFALFVHLVPAFVLIILLALAWRRAWLGAVLFAAARLSCIFVLMPRHIPPTTKLVWCLTIAGLAFLVAAHSC